MYGLTAKSEQFRERVGSDATKGSRKGYAEGGENPLTQLSQEEQRGSLVAVLKGLLSELEVAKLGRDPHRVKQLGRRIYELNNQINAMRPKRRSSHLIGDYFVDVCREQMTKPQFNLVMDEACERYRKALAQRGTP